MLMYIFYNLYHSIMIIIFNLCIFRSPGSTPEVLRFGVHPEVLRPTLVLGPTLGLGNTQKGQEKRKKFLSFQTKVIVYFVK